METTKLKKFATEARSKLRAGVASKIRSLGFDADGNAVPGMEPTPMVGGCTWNGQILPSAFAEQWEALRRRLKAKGLKEVVEEGAYTWFNRLMAIRILSMNGIAEPVLRFVDEARTPKIVDDARQGRVITMPDLQLQRLRKLFDDPTRINEQFALLVTEFCHQTPILQACFGSLADYTELLLPNNILDKGGFIEMLNTADFISEDDYKSAELIGWLYQFYISDRKDEVFAKKGKVEADEIPAATQIFTPNWIVKYMVQNAVLPQVRSNRLPEEDKTYLIDKDAPEEPKKPKDLRVADLACGSGHILNECFDLLYDLYIASGFGRGEAIESIFANNLLGIDIDERARQLATFALMLKACQRDESFADAHILPRILTAPDMPESVENPEDYLPHFFLGNYDKEIAEAWKLVKDAHTLGSIIKFDISPVTRSKMEQKVKEWRSESDIPYGIQLGLPIMDFILALTDSYDAIVMNPPYMPTSRVDLLKEYAAKNYPDSKTDLFSVFMDVCIDRLKDGGKYSMINMQSWMFLSSFETLRKKIIDTQHIDSLLHLGPRTFDELSGEVVQNAAFVSSKTAPNTAEGIYYRLIDGKSCVAKRDMFLAEENRYIVADQKQFEQIPCAPIAYWVSDKVMETFTSNLPLSAVCKPTQGLATADNGRFLRQWFEVSIDSIGFGCESASASVASGRKFFPTTKGGSFRRWYGNMTYLVNWQNNGEELKAFKGSVIRNEKRYFTKSGCSWSTIASGKPSFRYFDKSWLFETKGSVCFPENESDNYNIMGYLNSPLVSYFLGVLSPTLDYHEGPLSRLPYKVIESFDIKEIVSECISISKQDWDAHETSWDFQFNELVAISKSEIENRNSIEAAIEAYERKWTDLFFRLHANEEELNRQFIEIYGLKDELTPDVPLDEVTILQQGEISIKDGEIVWNNDVVIKQLISYIVGVWMGRYRLYRPGLNIAHPDPSEIEISKYKIEIDGREEWLTIDDDAIIPILPTGAPFEDNLTEYIANFVRIAWGEASQTDNLNFIEQCLGKKIEDYVQKDFWKDHKKMYQNRPIYWLFSSKKGAFKALVYVHRMHPYTVEQVRTRYLLKYMDWLRSEAQRLEIRDADLTTAERRRLDRLRSDIEECEEYHERLQVIAEQAIPIDLDNGIPANHAQFGDVVTKLK
ncbi:BREX-1 system adenine-specific DNA-methyltransferase PglX [uncultured Duncaniella sp.]|uniref:BREX-1 system adenine-specific DNA-methyltransferase PglX n=1 Tax=uncultured Duncaniella sp. TaxID=2768039 RepID=UPI0025B6B0F9|nr:BREX-1 system adenine-specific DNA-methyltransferase PglX [uncultured Duncaniella sp.]